jgi:DNA repair protein RadC
MTGYFLMVCEEGGYPKSPLSDWKISDPISALFVIEDFYRTANSQEQVSLITLDGAHQVINIRVITIGILNQSQIHPREIFRPAIQDNAASIMICHNHPSGSVTPSSDDIAVTKKLAEAGEILGIRLLDHIIYSGHRSCSLHQEGYF